MGAACDVHKWLVFICCYSMVFFYLGLFYSFGAIFVDIMSTFNITRAQTAAIQSVGFGISLGLGVVWGIIINRFGILRCGMFASILASSGLMSCYFASSVLHMIISVSIVFGTGYSCLAICGPVAIGEHFPEGRRKVLLLSIVNTGGAVGGFTYPFILRYLSDRYGFRGALLILGGLTMNCIPLCLLWKQRISTETTHTSRKCSINAQDNNQDSNQSATSDFETNAVEINETVRKPSVGNLQTIPVRIDAETRVDSMQQGYLNQITNAKNSKKTKTLKQHLLYLFKNSHFVVFVVGFVIAYPALSLIMIFIADIFEDKSLTVEDATLALLVVNIFGVLGRFLPGVLLQAKCVPTMLCPLLATMSGTVVLFGFLLATSRTHLFILCAINGMSSGIFSSMYSVIAANLVDIKSLPTAYGVLFTSSGIGNAIAGPVCGYMRDVYNTYSVPLYGAACMTILASLLFLITLCSKPWKKGCIHLLSRHVLENK